MPQFIARLWHGHCPMENSEKFFSFLKTEVENIPGLSISYMHKVETEKQAHFFVCTFWKDWESLKAFAGDNFITPLDDPFDIECGVISDPIVTHFVVSEIIDPFYSKSIENPCSKSISVPNCIN